MAQQQTSRSLAEPSAEVPAEPSGAAGVDSLAGGSLRVQVSFPAASLAPHHRPCQHAPPSQDAVGLLKFLFCLLVQTVLSTLLPASASLHN